MRYFVHLFSDLEILPMLANVWSYFVTAAKHSRELQIRKYIWLICASRSTKLNSQECFSSEFKHSHKLYSHLCIQLRIWWMRIYTNAQLFDTVAYDGLSLLEEPLWDRFISLRNPRTFASDFLYSLRFFYISSFYPSLIKDNKITYVNNSVF